MAALGGYTPLQAQRLKDKLDIDMARIEDLIAHMNGLVPDRSDGAFWCVRELEDIRFRVTELKDTITRRTRR